MDDAMRSAPDLQVPAFVLIAEKDQVIPPPASAAMTATLPFSAEVKTYPLAYHMMLRDLHGDIPTNDIIGWIRSVEKHQWHATTAMAARNRSKSMV